MVQGSNCSWGGGDATTTVKAEVLTESQQEALKVLAKSYGIRVKYLQGGPCSAKAGASIKLDTRSHPQNEASQWVKHFAGTIVQALSPQEDRVCTWRMKKGKIANRTYLKIETGDRLVLRQKLTFGTHEYSAYNQRSGRTGDVAIWGLRLGVSNEPEPPLKVSYW